MLKFREEKGNPTSSSSSPPPPSPPPLTPLVHQSDFKFHQLSDSLQEDTKKFLKYVLNNFTRATSTSLGFTSIHKFSLQFPFNQKELITTSRVHYLIYLALNFRVQKLELLLTNGDVNEYFSDSDINQSFHLLPLPDILNGKDFLTKMDLAMCSFDELLLTDGGLKWDNLKKLKLTHTCLDRINNIVEGCPSLSSLKLFDCWGFKMLDFQNHKTLNLLWLDGVLPKREEELENITISAPTIKRLGITGKLNARHIVLGNIEMCTDANIDFHWTTGDHDHAAKNGGYNSDMLQEFLFSLKHVKVLYFGTWFIQTISRMLFLRFTLPLCTELTLLNPILPIRYHNGMLRIITSCKNLEKLTIRDRRTHPSCKICSKLCIHDTFTTDKTILSITKQRQEFGFKTFTFYNKDDDDATATTKAKAKAKAKPNPKGKVSTSKGKIDDKASKNNHIGDLPQFVRFLIKYSIPRPEKVYLN